MRLMAGRRARKHELNAPQSGFGSAIVGLGGSKKGSKGLESGSGRTTIEIRDAHTYVIEEPVISPDRRGFV
jgi:hypothetical protein